MIEEAPAHNDFAEPLPAQCPPETAQAPEEALLIRLWKSATPSPEAFVSHAGRRLPVRGDTSPCKHASCSMFEHDTKNEQLNAMRALPQFRNFTHAFLVKVHPNCGVVDYGFNKHVDLWMFRSFDPVAAVEQVVAM